MIPSEVRNGLKANLEAIKGIRVYELIPTPAVAPAGGLYPYGLPIAYG